MYRMRDFLALVLLAIRFGGSGTRYRIRVRRRTNRRRAEVFDATGALRAEEVDYAKQRKGRPTVYAFIERIAGTYRWLLSEGNWTTR